MRSTASSLASNKCSRGRHFQLECPPRFFFSVLQTVRFCDKLKDRQHVLFEGGFSVQQIIEMAKSFDWSPFWISLKTGIVATVICFFLGLFAARKVLKLGPKARAVIDGILTLPMVMAPTVAGFFLLLLFSLRRPIGAFLYAQMGIKVVQTWLGCIIAASVIAFPLMYRNARAAFEQVDPDLIYAARTLGMKERTIFWRVVMPAAGPGVASGTVLTFARALGEYGATAMLAGNIAGKTGTISQKIANVIKDGDYATASVWVVIMLVIALVIIMVINCLSGGKNRKQNRW